MPDAVESFWPDFGKNDNFIEVECASSDSGSLAIDVLRYYNIPVSASNVGGELKNLDIKHMDALQIVKLSLLEESSSTGSVYEAMVNEYGEVEFNAVGEYSGNVSDQYYTIQTMSYVEECLGVIVRGSKPLINRLPIEWKLIWGEGDASSKEVYSTTVMSNNCLKENYSQYATIVFNDPHLDTNFEDGVSNLFEIDSDNPWQRNIGYAFYKYIPEGLVTKDTVIRYTQEASVPVLIASKDGDIPPDLGTLQPRPVFEEADATLNNPNCFVGLGDTANFQYGIDVPISDKLRFESIRNTTIDKFVEVSKVFAIGYEVRRLTTGPKTDALRYSTSENDFNVYVSIDGNTKTVFNLESGVHWAVAYDDSNDEVLYKQPRIVFANNARVGQVHNYGTCSYIVDPHCSYYQKTGQETGTGTILPTGETSGILVEEVWAVIKLNTPSITIYDPDGVNERALEIAQGMEYWVGAMMMEDKPAPIAFNGTLIDQVEGIKDHDPTTAQSFEDTPLELAMDEMDGGGGLDLTYSFLDGDGDYDTSEEQVRKMSEALFDAMNYGDGIVTTYVCGPEAQPKLGGRGPSNGIINKINYVYTDSNSYTISVEEGPMIVGGFASIAGGVTLKTVEEVSVNGTILEDLGNHIHYKVRMDEIGERVAINCQHNILRVGDRVTCSVHNNPVEA